MNIATIFDGIAPGARSERGFAGEYFARHFFNRYGFIAEKQSERKRGDLRVIEPVTGQVWKVEVKTAHRRPDGKWCFQIIGTGNASTDYRHADYLFLLALLSGGKIATYLIPTKHLKNRKTITISNVNKGMWTDYRVKGRVTL